MGTVSHQLRTPLNAVFDCTDVQLPALLAECMDMLHPLADAASVRLLPVEARPSLTVYADPTRLRQVVLNLVCNAIKYNRPEGTVRVLAESTPDGVRVQGIDTGVGISQAQLPTLGEGSAFSVFLPEGPTPGATTQSSRVRGTAAVRAASTGFVQ